MLTGRRALVTGSTGGIGHAIATALARSGCNVMLNGLEPDGSAACAPIEDVAPGRAHYTHADLATDDGVTALIRATRDRLGGIDILVNNAVTRAFAPIEQMAPADWHRALAVNLTAPFHTIRLALPQMRAAGWGRIVNMSSVYGSRGAVDRCDYVTTKTALLGLTRAVAMETAEDDITCNAVCPGAVCTPASEARIVAAMARDNASRAETERAFLVGKGPAGRFVAAEDVAALVVFLCGPAARDITGATLPVDSGWLAS